MFHPRCCLRPLLKALEASGNPGDDLLSITDDAFLKIAAFHFDSSEDYIYPRVKHLEKDLQVVVSGQNWLDISNSKANKGYALKKLQADLGVSKEHTVVFGDYNNDIEMLELAHYSVAMENAHPNVKKTAKYSTKSNSEQGVEYILNQILSA